MVGVERAALLNCAGVKKYHRAIRKQGTTTLLVGGELGDNISEVVRNTLLLNGSFKPNGASGGT